MLSDFPELNGTDRTIDQGNVRAAAARGPDFITGGPVTYIGQYRLLEEIARGGMGIVYKAKQEKLGRSVALKMILFGPLASNVEVDRFRREAQSAARLQHPNIVSVHEIGRHHGHYFFTMDYIESDSLADRLREGSLAADESARFVMAIARAMHYAHEKGVLHRDLKPANILVDFAGQPHITDFGLAKALADVDHETLREMTLTGQIIGTPSYMSPKQASAKSDLVDVRSDVYSLGAILYACLVGRAPFVGESSAETLHQVLHADPPRVRLLNARVPRDLETICHKCLQKEPHLRYGNAAELADDLDRYLNGLPISAKPVGWAAHAWKWCKRRPDVTTLLAALAATLLIGVTTVVFLWRTAETRRWQAEKSEHDAKQTLYDSWLREAQATRVARRSGYRGDVWRLLREAPHLGNVEHDHDRVRREAIACLGDFVGLTPLSIDGPVLKDAVGVSVFLDEHHLAVADADVFIRDLRSGKETSRLYRVGQSVVAMESIPGGRGLLLVDQQRTECWNRSERGSWIRSWTQESGYPSLYMDLISQVAWQRSFGKTGSRWSTRKTVRPFATSPPETTAFSIPKWAF